jgi:endonuclease/exonuclease/phosphatase family metal-dependent hydrolase
MFISLLLSGFLTLVELNCENLFDYQHDSLKQDQEYLPDAPRRWTSRRYWRKLNNIGQEILSCCDDAIPGLVALCEVENDSVLRDLTRRSLLRNAGYEYLVTNSPDVRGVDVALLYSPFAFALVNWRSIRVTPVEGMRPTRDILYAAGRITSGDTLHVFVVHAPSRYGGERRSRPFRLCVAQTLCQALDSLQQCSPDAKVVVAGDFNDYDDSPSLKLYAQYGLRNLTVGARGRDDSNGRNSNRNRDSSRNDNRNREAARGTYRYKGLWGSLDHVLASPSLARHADSVFINDALFLTEEETTYGGRRPRRTYNGMKYQPGYSDHLPLVVRFSW